MKKFLIILTIIALCSTSYIIGYNSVTKTTNLELVKIAEGDLIFDWFDTMNNNLDLIDDVFDDVTLTEFGYVAGVTSDIQTQFGLRYLKTEMDSFSEIQAIISDKTLVNTTNKLSAFAATTSAELAGVISDETGTGVLVYGTAPTLSDVHTDIWLTQDSNTFFGVGVAGAGNLEHTTGDTGYFNTAMGTNALYSNTVGFKNIAIGHETLRSNTLGNNNVSIGRRSLYANTSGTNNVAMGTESLRLNTIGSYNMAMGTNALYSNTASSNVGIGFNALFANTTGNSNTAIGYCAGRYQANGSTALITPENSVYIGSGTRGYDNNDNNSIVIGYNAIGVGANTTVIGNSSITDTYLSGNVHAVSSAYIQTVVTMDDGDLTPDVSAGNVFISQENTGATAITDLDNPTVGQEVTIICGHATNAPTIADGGNFKMEGNWTSDIDDSITFLVTADNYYIELSRSVN